MALGQKARTFLLVAVGAATAGTLFSAPRSVPAKEHTAACADLSRFVARMQTTMLLATLQRGRGSSLGAYQVLRTNIAAIAGEADKGHCGTLTSTLTTALHRAALAQTALEGSIELDVGLQGALALAVTGRAPIRSAPPKLLAVSEARLYGADCPDLFRLVTRLQSGAKDAADSSIPGPAASSDNLSSRVANVLSDLRDSHRCPRVRDLLEHAPASSLAFAVDSLRLDEPNDPTPDQQNASARCPELPIIAERLKSAISVGAPLYNDGDAAGCRRTYEEVSRQIVGEIIRPGRCPLVRGILDAGLSGAARTTDANDAAWTLRRSFDAILKTGFPANLQDDFASEAQPESD